MTRPRQQTQWLYVEPGMCVLAQDGSQWWVMDRRFNRETSRYEYLLESGGRRVVQAPEHLEVPVTIEVWGYDDRIELLRLALDAKIIPEDSRPEQIRRSQEVVTSPDKAGPRETGSSPTWS